MSLTVVAFLLVTFILVPEAETVPPLDCPHSAYNHCHPTLALTPLFIILPLSSCNLSLLCPSPAFLPATSSQEEEEEEGQEEIKTPELAKQILMLCIIASALDSGGDEGTRMARGTSSNCNSDSQLLILTLTLALTPNSQPYL